MKLKIDYPLYLDGHPVLVDRLGQFNNREVVDMTDEQLCSFEEIHGSFEEFVANNKFVTVVNNATLAAIADGQKKGK